MVGKRGEEGSGEEEREREEEGEEGKGVEQQKKFFAAATAGRGDRRAEMVVD